MYTLLIVLIVLASVLMCFIVLIQESKGGGLASGFSASNQIMGVRKTTDFIEKTTWGLFVAIVLISVVSAYVVPQAVTDQSVIFKDVQEQGTTGPANLPGFGNSASKNAQPNGAAPAGGQSSEPTAPAQPAN
jgi:preprotein translocase subunit SecG